MMKNKLCAIIKKHRGPVLVTMLMAEDTKLIRAYKDDILLQLGGREAADWETGMYASIEGNELTLHPGDGA